MSELLAATHPATHRDDPAEDIQLPRTSIPVVFVLLVYALVEGCWDDRGDDLILGSALFFRGL